MAVKKKDKRLERALDAVIIAIRLAFFIFFPAVFSTAFAGVKNIVQQIAARAPIAVNSFIQTLLIVCIVTILAGRIFCGFACAFGSLGDFVYWMQTLISRKLGRRPLRLTQELTDKLRYGKYLVLTALLALVWLGKGQLITKTSPWTAFSLIHTGHFSALNAVCVLLLFLVVAGMAVEPRFFCRFLCPMGAIFSMLPVMPWAVVHRQRENCLKGCKACLRRCPSGLDIPDKESGDPGSMGECISCLKCMRICPKGNIHVLPLDEIMKAEGKQRQGAEPGNEYQGNLRSEN